MKLKLGLRLSNENEKFDKKSHTGPTTRENKRAKTDIHQLVQFIIIKRIHEQKYKKLIFFFVLK